jgi:DNA polymerase elongation subunit (family B)
MLLDVEQKGKTLKISYFDKEGNTKFKTYEVDSVTNWQVCSDKDKSASTEWKNWDGRPVKKAAAKALDKYSLLQFFESLPKEESDEIFTFSLPKIYFVDIEVEVTDTFPEPSRADNPVTTIAIVTPAAQVIVLATKDLERNQQIEIQDQIDDYFKEKKIKFKFAFKKFDSEYDMLYTFFDSFVKKFPMMSGWNFINFDWTYLTNRAIKLGLDPSLASPSGELIGQERIPLHVGVLDYLDLYKKWDRSVDIKENFTLDSTAEVVVGLKKIKYSGSLQDLYNKDYQKYVFYNAVDTCLVYLIHDKIKTMEIALTIANMCKMGIYKAASPVAITESLLCRKFLEQKKVMAKDWEAAHQSRDTQYAGAFVKQPEVGIHKAVACFDFASLYPSIMRQINVSPDSFIKKVDPSQRESEMGPNRIVSVTGAVYSKEDSILKKILTDLYSQRKAFKRTSFDLQMEAEEIRKKIKSLKSSN